MSRNSSNVVEKLDNAGQERIVPHLCHNLLVVAMAHEVLLLLNIGLAGVAGAVRRSRNMIPHGLIIAVVVGVRSMVAGKMVGRNVCSIGLRLVRSSRSDVEDSPIVVSWSSTGRAHILGSV